MTLAAVCYMTFCTVTWVEMDSPIRAVVTGTSVVDQSLKTLAMELIIEKEAMKLKYKNDFQNILDMSVDRQMNPSLENIQVEVRKQAAEGNSRKPCYDKAVVKSLTISNYVFKKMMPCLNTFRREFDDILNKVHEAIKRITDMEKTIRNMIPECQVKDDVQQCVKTNVMQATVFLQKQKDDVAQLKQTVKDNYANSLTDALTCVSEHGNELSNAAESIKAAAIECMRS
uniref:Cyd25 protein n=1 Tax=Cyphononyx dorsalis TaxID=246266 RepID=A5HUI8_CYPDO|nr:cyd25 [Cyphononyx dorsalis]